MAGEKQDNAAARIHGETGNIALGENRMVMSKIWTATLVFGGLVLHLPSRAADPASPDAVRPAKAGLAVVTLNMARLTDTVRIAAEWRQSPALRDADVYLLQEVVHFDDEQNPSVGHLLAKELNLQVVSAPSIRRKAVDGLAILSRYPLIEVEVKELPKRDLLYRTRTRIVLAATVDAPCGRVRVFNTHLDTRINAKDRVEQIQPIIDEAAAWKGPRLVGGDFNTNGLFWIGSAIPFPFSPQGKAIRQAMEQQGFSTPMTGRESTFDFFRFHLDWIYTRGLKTAGLSIEPVRFSDHHAVRAWLSPDSGGHPAH